MRHGLGVLRWPPSEFWNATPTELYRGIEGWQECHGMGSGSKTVASGYLTEEEVGDLQELMERFPDE